MKSERQHPLLCEDLSKAAPESCRESLGRREVGRSRSGRDRAAWRRADRRTGVSGERDRLRGGLVGNHLRLRTGHGRPSGLCATPASLSPRVTWTTTPGKGSGRRVRQAAGEGCPVGRQRRVGQGAQGLTRTQGGPVPQDIGKLAQHPYGLHTEPAADQAPAHGGGHDRRRRLRRLDPPPTRRRVAGSP